MRTRRAAIAATAAALSLGGGVVAAGRLTPAEPEPAAPPAGPAPNTARVERADIVETTEYDGTLDYRDHRTVTTPADAPATVTALVEAGVTVGEGELLYALDTRPTVVLDGKVPMYRTLADNSPDGPDVRQLERYLVSAGYDPDGELTVDDEFTWKTAELVEVWETDLGVGEPDGVVEQGQVVFLPGSAVVTQSHVHVGQAIGPAAPVVELALLGSGRVVTAEVPLSEQGMVAPGTEVAVRVGDLDVAGQVESVLPAALPAPGGQDAEPVAVVRVAVAAADVPQVSAPADVVVATTRASGVLVVPVAALVQLAEGGYAVELAEPSGTRLVGVTPGEFGDNVVEVAGAGIAAGAEVVIP